MRRDRPILQRCLRTLLLAALGHVLAVAPASAQPDPAAFFKQNCASCHTIGGGRLTGPDLKDVTGRRDRAWLLHYLPNPQAMIDSGDPYAAQLLKEARGVIMPSVPGLTPALADALVSLIEAESLLEKSHFAGLQISDRPFTADDMRRGRQLFRGDVALTGAGAPCLSCHTVNGIGAPGGGKLGPDLTKAYERLQGRQAMGAWLSAPATPTMQSVFGARPLAAEEILPLLAYFENAARQGGEDTSISSVQFLLLGLGMAAIGLVAFDRAWANRLRGVRRPLVASVGPKR